MKETQSPSRAGQSSGAEVSPLMIVAGGKKFVAEFLDGRPEELTLIRQLPVKCYDAYLDALQDERLQVALFCDRPLEWVDALSPASFHAVMVAGEEMNVDFFVAWYRRRIDRMERMNPGAKVGMQKQLDQLTEVMMSEALAGQATTSKNSSPASPLSAGSVSEKPAS